MQKCPGTLACVANASGIDKECLLTVSRVGNPTGVVEQGGPAGGRTIAAVIIEEKCSHPIGRVADADGVLEQGLQTGGGVRDPACITPEGKHPCRGVVRASFVVRKRLESNCGIVHTGRETEQRVCSFSGVVAGVTTIWWRADGVHRLWSYDANDRRHEEE